MTDGKKLAEIQAGAQRRVKNKKIFTCFLIVIIALTFFLLAFLNLFDIKTVNVNGISAAVPYTPEDVRDFLDIGDNTNLITYDSKRAKRALLYEFPYIDSIDIKKRFPSTLEINITENKGTLYITLGEDTFILSSGGSVLEINNDPFYDTKNRAELLAPGVKRCVCGEDIVFEKEETLNILLSLTEQLEQYKVIDKITKIDIRDKFEIIMMYDNRFEIELGTFENMENKIKLISKMMKNKIWEDTTGHIDISNGTKALVKFTGNVAN